MMSSIPLQKKKKYFDRYILPIDGTLTGTITPGPSEPGINGNEEVLYTPNKFQKGSLTTIWSLVSYPSQASLHRKESTNSNLHRSSGHR